MAGLSAKIGKKFSDSAFWKKVKPSSWIDPEAEARVQSAMEERAAARGASEGEDLVASGGLAVHPVPEDISDAEIEALIRGGKPLAKDVPDQITDADVEMYRKKYNIKPGEEESPAAPAIPKAPPASGFTNAQEKRRLRYEAEKAKKAGLPAPEPKPSVVEVEDIVKGGVDEDAGLSDMLKALSPEERRNLMKYVKARK